MMAPQASDIIQKDFTDMVRPAWAIVVRRLMRFLFSFWRSSSCLMESWTCLRR
jgi:hypothetical protein